MLKIPVLKSISIIKNRPCGGKSVFIFLLFDLDLDVCINALYNFIRKFWRCGDPQPSAR